MGGKKKKAAANAEETAELLVVTDIKSELSVAAEKHEHEPCDVVCDKQHDHDAAREKAGLTFVNLLAVGVACAAFLLTQFKSLGMSVGELLSIFSSSEKELEAHAQAIGQSHLNWAVDHSTEIAHFCTAFLAFIAVNWLTRHVLLRLQIQASKTDNQADDALISVGLILFPDDLFQKTNNDFDDEDIDNMVEEVEARMHYVIALATLTIAACFGTKMAVPLTDEQSHTLNLSLVTAIIMRITAPISMKIGGLVTALDWTATTAGVNKGKGLSFIGTAVKIMTWAVAGVAIAQAWGYDCKQAVAGLGIGGFALALGLQPLIQDFFSVVLILINKPFQVGDLVDLGGGVFGTVESIKFRRTMIRLSASGQSCTVPNSSLTGKTIQNYADMEQRRGHMEFTVSYNTPPKVLEQIPYWVKAIVEAQKDTTAGWCALTCTKDWGLQYKAFFYIGQKGDWALYCDVNQAIHIQVLAKLNEQGVQIAYPSWVKEKEM